jgi:triosephosphate isomerase
MRTPILAGNWKMFKTVGESLEFASAVSAPLDSIQGVEKVICAPFTALPALAGALKGTSIQLGAQNVFWEDQGAYTGEISAAMLRELCQVVIIGHSERRQLFGETDEAVNKKLRAALKHGLTPIVCVGESLAQNQAGETERFVGRQVGVAFDTLTPDEARMTAIAYEPIWAIGTGLAATAEDANRIIGGVVRQTLSRMYGPDTAGQIRILYGGSVNTKNVDELMSQPEIDGGLVGGASLKPDDYVTLVQVTASAKGSS